MATASLRAHLISASPQSRKEPLAPMELTSLYGVARESLTGSLYIKKVKREFGVFAPFAFGHHGVDKWISQLRWTWNSDTPDQTCSTLYSPFNPVLSPNHVRMGFPDTLNISISDGDPLTRVLTAKSTADLGLRPSCRVRRQRLGLQHREQTVGG